MGADTGPAAAKLRHLGLLVAPLIALKANHIRYRGGGDGGRSTIHADMTSPAALEASRTTHLARRLVRPAALATVASTLLALPSRINYLGPLT